MNLRVKVQVLVCRQCNRLLKGTEIFETGRFPVHREDTLTTYRMRCSYCGGVVDWLIFKPKKTKGGDGESDPGTD